MIPKADPMIPKEDMIPWFVCWIRRWWIALSVKKTKSVPDWSDGNVRTFETKNPLSDYYNTWLTCLRCCILIFVCYSEVSPFQVPDLWNLLPCHCKTLPSHQYFCPLHNFSKNLHCSEMRMLAWWTKMSCCLCLRFVRFVRSQSWIDQTSSPICWGFSLAWSTDLCERHGTRRLVPRWNHGEVSLVSSFVHDIFHRFWKDCCSHSSRFPLLSSEKILHICNHRHILMLQIFLNWWWLDGEVFDPFDSGKIGFQASAVIWTLCEYAMSRNNIKRRRVVFTCLYARTNYIHMIYK